MPDRGRAASMATARARRSRRGRPAASRAARAARSARAEVAARDNSEQIIETIVSETGKTLRGRLARRDRLRRATRSSFWAKPAPKYLADEKRPVAQAARLGQKLIVRYRPLGVVGVIGPWNYPLTNSFGDCHPGARRRQQRDAQAVRGHAADLAADRRSACASAACPTDVFQVATGRGETGAALIDAVDMIMFTGSTAHRQEGHGAGGADADPRVAGARRQGPDDRAGRRGPRARGQLRRLLLDAERRPDVHLDRARLRRGARSTTSSWRRWPRRCARCAMGRRTGRARSTSARSPSRRSCEIDRRPRRRGDRQGRARGRRRPRRARAPAASTSRPCWSTSTTR